MKLIQPNCRIQFTAADIDFVRTALGQDQAAQDALTQLLVDPDCRDQILDDDRILKALLDNPVCLPVSGHFYFYVVVRSVLRRAGVEDRGVADYVAEVLTEFSQSERIRCGVRENNPPLEYFFEMVAALRDADDRTGFCLRAHMGNCALFLSGVFSERILWRAARKGAPGLDYYTQLGRSSFRQASDHRLAERYRVAAIYDTLSDQFERVRRALGDLSDRVMSLGDPPLPILKSLYSAPDLGGGSSPVA